MHGHQGQGQDEFVLQQFMQIGARLQGQYVVFAVLVQPRRFIVATHEAQSAVDGQGLDAGLQAALALQHHLRLRLQLQPQFGLATRHRACRSQGPPLHGRRQSVARQGVQAVEQARETGLRPFTPQLCSLAAEQGQVQPLRVESPFLGGHGQQAGRPMARRH